jgi:EpsI family protein
MSVEMLSPARPVRPLIAAGILLSAFLLLNSLSHGEPIVPRQQLHALPYELATWRGQEVPFSKRIIEAVGVSDYTNRVYFDQSNVPVHLYVGYYASQRTGDTIHSPKNCLPGAGWDPVQSGYLRIPIFDQEDIVVNKYVIEKDLDKQLVLYWYQGRGRIIASEYSGKLWMMVDAISRNRTDGALVRLVTPMNDGESHAQARLSLFTRALFPALDSLIPK